MCDDQHPLTLEQAWGDNFLPVAECSHLALLKTLCARVWEPSIERTVTTITATTVAIRVDGCTIFISGSLMQYIVEIIELSLVYIVWVQKFRANI